MESIRRRVFAIVPLTVVALVGLAGGACSEQRRSLGEDCLKGDDCLSNTCSAQRCAAAPPTANGGTVATVPDAEGDVSPPSDAESDADAQAPVDSASADVIRDSGGDE